MPARLKLSRENWWQEIGSADLSPMTKGLLRAAVNAYLNNVIPPAITSNQFFNEVASIELDGELLIATMQAGEVSRLSLLTVKANKKRMAESFLKRLAEKPELLNELADRLKNDDIVD